MYACVYTHLHIDVNIYIVCIAAAAPTEAAEEYSAAEAADAG